MIHLLDNLKDLKKTYINNNKKNKLKIFKIHVNNKK